MLSCKNNEKKVVLHSGSNIRNTASDSIEGNELDSIEREEAKLNKGRSFACGIHSFWVRNKIVPFKVTSLSQEMIQIDSKSYVITFRDMKLRDSVITDFVSNIPQGGVSFYKIEFSNARYFLLKSRYAAATQSYTLMNFYLLIDAQEGKSYSFASLATADQSFFIHEKSGDLRIVRFVFADSFYDKSIISMKANVCLVKNDRIKTVDSFFLDCICK
jgi:hypothetical protein